MNKRHTRYLAMLLMLPAVLAFIGVLVWAAVAAT